MRSLHDHHLAIAAEIRKICVQNDIQYFIIAGTLLGAVRHRGFIPWDDDMDIGMLRHDYDKFLACAAEQLPKWLILQTWNSDAAFGLPMAKVREEGTRFIEQSSTNVRDHKGIFVDIFPFDECPTSLIKQRAQSLSTYILKRLILSRLSYCVGTMGSIWKIAAFKVLALCAKGIPLRWMIVTLEHEMQKYNGLGKGNFVAIGGSYGYRNEMLKREWFQELTQVEFEKLAWPCFRQWDAYLEHMYGDYMRLPPIEQRGKRHSVVEISFGNPSERGPM